MKRILLAVMLSLFGAAPLFSQNYDAMDRIEICKKNYRALFGGEALSGGGADPELMDILQKFIFGEVFRTGRLDLRQREMITCVCLATMQTLPQLKAHAGAALNVGVTPVELREAIYQCAPFIGFPRTLNAVETLNAVFRERGLSLPLAAQATVTEEDRHRRGAAVQRPLYGDEIREAMRGLPDGMDEAVPDFLTELCFGDFYTRGALDVKSRELLSLCVLATLGAERQIAAHAAGCLHAGCERETLYAAMVQCLPYVGFPNALNAIRTIAEIPDSRSDGEAPALSEELFGRGAAASAEYFTGKAFVKELVPKSDSTAYAVGNVVFEAGCRNHWHRHPVRQILLVTEGHGWYQERGKAAQALAKGDVCIIPADVEHWHGATKESRFVHLVITDYRDDSCVVWGAPVTDEEYDSL